MKKRIRIKCNKEEPDNITEKEIYRLQQSNTSLVHIIEKDIDRSNALKTELLTLKESIDYLNKYKHVYVDIRLLDEKTIVGSLVFFNNNEEEPIVTMLKPHKFTNADTYRIVVK